MTPVLRTSKSKNPPAIPAGLRIYAVGDVHGRDDALADVFARIDRDMSENPAPRPVQIMLGDYIDRGPASRGVIERLLQREEEHEVLLLKGNHETFLTGFLEDPTVLDMWRQHGGLQFLISYGLKPSLRPSPTEQRELSEALAEAMPASHLKLVGRLPLTYRCGDFLFVHAGIRPGRPFNEQTEQDLLWIREDFLLHERPFEQIVIHGHTPGREPDVRSNRINLDVGAYATGRLACLVIEGDRIRFI